MKPRWQAKGLVLSQLLKELKRTRRRLEDVPAPVLREVQKRGFPDMRAIFLPPPIIRRSLQQPLLRDLLVTRIGYCSTAAGHYIPRPDGSLDHILTYCVGGKGWLRMAGQEWTVPAGTAIFLPSGVPHSYGADTADPWSFYWIHFTGKQAGDFFKALQVTADEPLMDLPCTPEILAALQAVEKHASAGQDRHHLIAAGAALAAFLGLLQFQRATRDQRERTTEENIRLTIEFMRANLSRPISLRELAALAHLSVSRYEVAFTKSIGCSSIKYLHRMKIQKACRLLTETNLPAKAISAEIGYDDPYYFSRLFKKMVGVSPMAYRKSSREGAAA